MPVPEPSPVPLRLVRRGEIVVLAHVAPDRTLLELLRETLCRTSVKEGCASGDCGACTVAVGEIGPDGALRTQAVNSCLRLAHSVDGMAVWTAEDLASADGALHPAQSALLACHGSQCGFCTPGFVMSLFVLHQQQGGADVSRDEALHALSGNLCRCTGYRPILQAAMDMKKWSWSASENDVALQQLKLLRTQPRPTPAVAAERFYALPTTLAEALAWRAAQPEALVVAGATDVGLWITKQQRRFTRILDIGRVAELRRLARRDGWLSVGAAVSLTEAFAALAEGRPQLASFFERFAGRPVRASGTLGGNVANGSPIGDSMPLLIALGARLVLGSARGQRELAIEDFYLGYRQTALAPDELLLSIEVPLPRPGEWLRADKISKRREDDISAVCLAIWLEVADGVVRAARVGAGGVAPVPARARRTEAALLGQPCDGATFEAAARVLGAEFEPLSDMRASSGYRRQVLGQLLRRAHAQRQTGLALDTLAPIAVAPEPRA